MAERSALIGRVHVFTNLAISFDGKITTAARAHIDPSPYDRYRMDLIRSRADAIVVGAGTLRAFRQANKVSWKRFALKRRLSGKRPQPLNVVLVSHPDFDPAWPFFTDPAIERLLVVPRSVSEIALKPFSAVADVFRYEEREDFPEQILAELLRRGCRDILLEGGGGIMFPWVERDLVDEWNVTVTPRVIGGKDAPTMVEGRGFDADHVRGYRLARHFRRDDEIFLRYRRR